MKFKAFYFYSIILGLILFFILSLCYVAQETYLLILQRNNSYNYRNKEFRAGALKRGAPVDNRSPTEVIRQLRQQLIPASAGTYPYLFLDKVIEFKWEGKSRVIFGNVPHSLLSSCIESGSYAQHYTDEFGLLNPKGVYKKIPIDVLLIGDSMVEGSCVKEGDRIADQIRKHFTSTVSLGLSTNGPLTNLGALKEFAPYLKPKIVLWFHVEDNDVWDLNREVESPLAKEFLEPHYQPWQLKNYTAISKKISGLSDKVLEYSEKEENKSVLNHWYENHPAFEPTLKFHPIRNALFPDHVYRRPDLTIHESYKTALLQAKTLTEYFGGKFIVVYLPSWERYKNKNIQSTRSLFLNLVNSAHLSMIDIFPVFNALKDPLALFPYRLRGHYLAEGNRLVAETILTSINGFQTKTHNKP